MMMKKIFLKNALNSILLSGLLLYTATFVASCTSSSDNPIVDPVVPPHKTYATMGEALKDVKIVESFSKVEQPDEKSNFKEEYLLRVLQPADHQHPDKYFQQKVYLRFRGFDRPTILVTNGYFVTEGSSDGHTLSRLLDANVVSVEHRNFGESVIDDPDKWAYETQYQESTDLHAIFTALKPILPGKWMSMGTSKSGETSIDYATSYPGDMDLCAAFCSPFLTSLYDVRCGKYMFEESGTAEQRAIVDAAIRRYLKDGEQGLYKDFCERLAKTPDVKKPNFSEYVYNVFDIYFAFYSYFGKEDRLPLLPTADTSVDELYAKWNYMLTQNRDPSTATYFIDCSKWQGLFMYDYDVYKDLLEATSFSPREVNLAFLNEKDRWIYDTYDNSFRLGQLNDYLPATPTPTLLVYSKDDPWTGARPPYINPVNTKLFINPDGIHSDELENEKYYKPELKQEILDFVKQYIH